MHGTAQSDPWGELTAIGTLILAFFTFAAVVATIVITITDRRRFDRRQNADAAALDKRLQDEGRERADEDALQVTVEFTPADPLAFGEGTPAADCPTHQITVTTPASYQVKRVEAILAWPRNPGLAFTGIGRSFTPPEFAGGQVRYRCWAKVSTQQPEASPIVRFTDRNGWQYYWYCGHTLRQPQTATWEQAAAAIDLWIRTGPVPDPADR